MTTLKEARELVTSVVAEALPDVPVYPAPPSNVIVPCALVTLGPALTQQTQTRWDARLYVTLVSYSLDNDSAVAWLEQALIETAAALSADLTLPITWNDPGQMTLAGQPYLAARMSVPIDLEV